MGTIFRGKMGMDNLHGLAGLFSGGLILGKSKYRIAGSRN